MCIRLRRVYLDCGDEIEKIVRCSLPYYWLNNRADDAESPPEPAQLFDKKQPNQPSAAYFGCFDCLDEIEEQYSLSCPDCSGQGSVHSDRDLVSRVAVKSGRDNNQAYELMKKNYHRYLNNFLQYWPLHTTYLSQMMMYFRLRRRVAEVQANQMPPDHPIWLEAIGDIGPNLWCGPDKMLENLMDKLLAELKCRQETTHPPPDAGLEWDAKETHLSEHIPALNNVSTALRRQLALDLETSLRVWLKMILAPERADDFDYGDGSSAMYDEQTFSSEAETYGEYMWAFRSEDIQGPYNQGKGPYDILEFVPQFQRETMEARMNLLSNDLLDELTRAEIEAPRGDPSLLGRRNPQTYQQHEDFITHTIGFIFQLLALDTGLSNERMVEIGRLFHSLLMEPWYEIYGHPELPSIPERGVGYLPLGHETDNAELRSILLDLVDQETRGGSDLPPELNWWWEKHAYHAVLPPGGIRQTVNLTWGLVYSNASHLWMTFYKNWLQVLANVDLSHEKMTQEELDDALDKDCPICGDHYDVNHEFNCPVYYGCPNGHVLDLKCYTTLSLTPTRPYNRLQADRFCPSCRAVISYAEDVSSDILADMQFMPTLETRLDDGSFRR